MSNPFFIGIMHRFMRFFYYLLYHPLAFTYDLVAAIVSFGKWKNWVYSINPFISGTRILELGHGPGHLQRLLLDRGLNPVAIDESTQMGRITKRRLGREQKLSRALAQKLPFTSNSFDTIISTFPTEYIFDAKSVAEIKRCLADNGRLIVLPVAFPKSRFLKWLYKVTGESPQTTSEAVQNKMAYPFTKAGFNVKVELIDLKSSTLWIIIGSKIPKSSIQI